MRVSDEQIYRDMRGEMPKEDLDKLRRILIAWADALDAVDGNVRVAFFACVKTVEVMGPAYCMLAADFLLAKAKQAR
jgi:hypothetical protein